MVPVFWLALIGAIYSRIAPFFALNCIFFPDDEEPTLKTKQPIRFQGLFKVINQTAGKWKTKSIIRKILQLFFPKLLFPPNKLKNLISNRPSTASIKYLNWPSPVFVRFQNGCNKVVIEPRVVQFWFEIILVITNRTRDAHLFDFEITRMISAQIALDSVQLLLSKIPFFFPSEKKGILIGLKSHLRFQIKLLLCSNQLSLIFSSIHWARTETLA